MTLSDGLELSEAHLEGSPHFAGERGFDSSDHLHNHVEHHLCTRHLDPGDEQG